MLFSLFLAATGVEVGSVGLCGFESQTDFYTSVVSFSTVVGMSFDVLRKILKLITSVKLGTGGSDNCPVIGCFLWCSGWVVRWVGLGCDQTKVRGCLRS